MEEIKTTTTPLGHELQFYQDWEKSEGGIWMVNAKTIDRYIELKNDQPKGEGVFFAFNKKQFDEGVDELIKKGQFQPGGKLLSAGGGMYGTKEGLDKFFEYYEEREEIIKKECDPQEVYFYEYNNHECMINWYGDKEAIEIVSDYWGKDVAKSIVRFSAFSEIGNDEKLAV